MIWTSLVIATGIIILACLTGLWILSRAMEINDKAQRNLVEGELLNRELHELIKVLPKEHRESSRYAGTDN